MEATDALLEEATGALLDEAAGALLVEATGVSSGERARRRRLVASGCAATDPAVEVQVGGWEDLAAALRNGEVGGQVGEKAVALRLAGTVDCNDGPAALDGPAAHDGPAALEGPAAVEGAAAVEGVAALGGGDGSCKGALGPREW